MRMLLTEDKKRAVEAGIYTLVVCVLMLLCLIFLGFSFQNPPPQEQGVEVNLGNSDFGLGQNSPDREGQEGEKIASSQSESSPNDVSTQSTEETINLYKKKRKDKQQRKPETNTKETTEAQEPTINQSALFPGKKSGNRGGSEGIAGGQGDQGRPGGDPNSNRYDGVPGGGGTSFSLRGREAKSLPKPGYNSNEQGTVVVKIWVDKMGNVIRAEAQMKGSTVTDGNLKKMAEEAAKRSSFSPSPNATEVQIGTITYKFLRSN